MCKGLLQPLFAFVKQGDRAAGKHRVVSPPSGSRYMVDLGEPFMQPGAGLWQFGGMAAVSEALHTTGH